MASPMLADRFVVTSPRGNSNLDFLVVTSIEIHVSNLLSCQMAIRR